MRWGSVITLVAVAGLIGWFAPSPRAGQRAAPVVKAAAASSTPAAGWDDSQAVLEREGDGHFYADAKVDSRPARFLVDTGASFVALTGEDAQGLGLTWSDVDVVPVGRGAGGTVYGVPVKLDRVELGDIEVRDVQAAIIPEGLDVSLLGQSFLGKVPGVRIEGDRMVLGGG